MDRSVGAYEAKTRFGDLLDSAERGETVVITRNGRPVAFLTPYADPDRADAIAAAKSLIEARQGMRLGGDDWEEMRDSGRR